MGVVNDQGWFEFDGLVEPMTWGRSTRADVLPDAFMYAGRPLLGRLGATAGDVVHCRLRPADPDHVPVPKDVEVALVDAGRLDAFELQPAPQRRRLLQPIEDARTAATRERRIIAMVRSLTP